MRGPCLDLGEPAYDLALSGTYGYVVTHSVYCDDEACTMSQGHLTVLDLGVPASPRVVSSIGRPKAPRGDRPWSYGYVETPWNQFVFNAYASSAPPVCY